MSTIIIPHRRRRRFRQWLRLHRRVARDLPFRLLLRLYGRDISYSAAYRTAVAEGLRGNRRNQTRYAYFWGTINWDLPDSVLHRIWGVARGNLRQRRVRLRAGPPKFALPRDSSDPRYVRAVAREMRRAEDFHGPRPH